MAKPTVFNHQYLLELVKQQLGDHIVEVEDAGWTVHDRTVGAALGLVNLAQHLDGIDESLWPDRVREWVGQLLRVRPSEATEYRQVAPRLRVRLTPDGSRPDWAVHRNVCEGLDEMLMLRNEVGCETVNDQQLATWGQPIERVWKDAREHTIWDETRQRRVLARGRSRVVWVRDSFFASSLLLDLDHLLSRGNQQGALAMAPCRDALLFVEMATTDVVHQAAAMMEIGAQFYVDGPGSISADVFWYRPGGRLQRIARAEGRGYESCWGDEFSKALAALEAKGR